MHNNEPEAFPFVAPSERRVNVSCELVNYRPVKLDALTSLLEECQQRLKDVDAAQTLVE